MKNLLINIGNGIAYVFELTMCGLYFFCIFAMVSLIGLFAVILVWGLLTGQYLLA